MSISNPFKITINSPCRQQWDDMPVESNGRNCQACNKIIIDFSQMSDNELLGYFKTNPNTHCGRFHNTQLNRNIIAQQERKNFFGKFTSIAATIMAFLSVKPVHALATSKNYSTEQAPPVKKSVINSITKFVISGTITDENGHPLKDANVVFDSTTFAKTDELGNFSFTVENITATSHHIYFNYDGLVTAVRTYHPAMASTIYNVKLLPPDDGHHTMGKFVTPILDLPSLVFKKGVTKLSIVQKTKLAVVARKLKENPEVNIEIKEYSPICGKQHFNFYRVVNVKTYLIQNEGISEDRIFTNCEVDGGDYNTIDIKQSEN